MNTNFIYLDKVFALLVGEREERDNWSGADFMQNIFITNKPPPKGEKICAQKDVAAVTISGTHGKYMILLCDYIFEFPIGSEVGCEKVGDSVSGMMDTIDGLLLHELT
jgi:hypothetical protein